jgi:uncharacterized protein with LGFP repeats
MSNLVSSVPGATTAFYNLLTAAAQAQSPKVEVFLDALGQDEPNSYICLGGPTPRGHDLIEKYEMKPAALGSGAVYESYEIWGYATVYTGAFDTLTVFQDTFDLYQSVVVDTFINYRGGFGAIGWPASSAILGQSAPESLEEITMDYADYSSQARGEGVAGVIEFCVSMLARLTIA